MIRFDQRCCFCHKKLKVASEGDSHLMHRKFSAIIGFKRKEKEGDFGHFCILNQIDDFIEKGICLLDQYDALACQPCVQELFWELDASDRHNGGLHLTTVEEQFL